MSFNENNLTFEEFRTKLLQMKVVKPYRPLIIKSLLNHFPKKLAQNIIANNIRNFFKNDDLYEKYNIWNQLVDFEKLLTEENSIYSLNVVSLSKDQILELIQICDKKIKACNESIEFVPKPTIMISQKNIATETETKNSNQNSPRVIMETSANSAYSNSEVTSQQLFRKEKHFIYKIPTNNQDELHRKKLSTISDNIKNQERRALEIEKNQTNEIIFYDTKEDDVRIWELQLCDLKLM